MKKIILIALPCFMFLTACTKDAGEGGTSSVYGKVIVRDYNAAFTFLYEEYLAQGERVYIIYGDDITHGDDVRTNYDGTFQFKYLRKGTYRIYAYSKDSTLQTNAMIPVIKEVEITENNSAVQIPDIIILD